MDMPISTNHRAMGLRVPGVTKNGCSVVLGPRATSTALSMRSIGIYRIGGLGSVPLASRRGGGTLAATVKA